MRRCDGLNGGGVFKNPRLSGLGFAGHGLGGSISSLAQGGRRPGKRKTSGEKTSAVRPLPRKRRHPGLRQKHGRAQLGVQADAAELRDLMEGVRLAQTKCACLRVDHGMPTDQAVERGIRTTASTVTSAAAVMIAVFAIFASLRTLDIKQLGVGLAVAVFIDATLIRGVLLPVAMKLLGDWNWYLPRWLEWMPRLTVEPKLGADVPEAPPIPAA